MPRSDAYHLRAGSDVYSGAVLRYGLRGCFQLDDRFLVQLTLAVLVIAFTYFYTAIIINPQMMADDMKRNGGFIPE